MKQTLLILSFLYTAISANAQDTLRVMQYNILNYRNTTQQCNGTTNSASSKEAQISKIIAYTLPDILCINEMGADFRNGVFLLDNALNKDGRNFYEVANFSNLTTSNIVNMLYYNKSKLALASQSAITQGLDRLNLIRQADVYRLFHKDNTKEGDTLFLHVIVVHLKAGSARSDEDERFRQAEAIMQYVQSLNPGENVILAGDFNVQSGFAGSYSKFVATEAENIRFYDPKDARANWNENALYSNLHTQSTRTTATSGGCFSGGGMDDRLDFILCNQNIIQGNKQIRCLESTYKAIGQDGQRFNSEINSGTNFAVPREIADALYAASDHLPVYVELAVYKKSASIAPTIKNEFFVQFNNPVKDVLRIRLSESSSSLLHVICMDLSGRTIINQWISIDDGEASLPLHLNPGIYVLQVENTKGNTFRKKMIIGR